MSIETARAHDRLVSYAADLLALRVTDAEDAGVMLSRCAVATTVGLTVFIVPEAETARVVEFLGLVPNPLTGEAS